MTAPMTPGRRVEIAKNAEHLAKYGDEASGLLRDQVARRDVPDLLAEVERLNDALAKAADLVAERDAEIGKLAARVAELEAQNVRLTVERDGARDTVEDQQREFAAARESRRAARADVLREAHGEVVAWLEKKAGERRAEGRQYAKQAAFVARLADKVRRGAIKVFPYESSGGAS